MDKHWLITTTVWAAFGLTALGSIAASALFISLKLGRIADALEARPGVEKRLAQVETELKHAQDSIVSAAKVVASYQAFLAEQERCCGNYRETRPLGDVAVPPEQGEDLGPV